jgi:hypothetical protein
MATKEATVAANKIIKHNKFFNDGSNRIEIH